MTNIESLDKNYSTTRPVTKEKPTIVNKLENTFESVLFLLEGENRQGEGGLRTQGYFKKSYEDKPLISIITVVYNGAEFLEETILSVINQTYDNIEYIIIDGGSTDGTLEIIRQYEKEIDYWVSEKDNGIYDAMNKGLKIATGDYINFMNGGDNFIRTSSLLDISQYLIDDKTTYFARAKLNASSSTWLYPNIKYNIDNIEVWLKKSLPNHQAMFFPKVFYQKVKYNLEYKIGSDSDYKFTAQEECAFEFIDQVLCEFKLDGVSSQLNSYTVMKEIMMDSWKISIRHKGLIYAIERQVKLISKYIINKILGDLMLRSLHKKFKG